MMKKTTDDLNVDFESSYTDFLRSEFLAVRMIQKTEELQLLGKNVKQAVTGLTTSREGEGEKVDFYSQEA